jgi:NADH-quinone oxidoreductase subunit G
VLARRASSRDVGAVARTAGTASTCCTRGSRVGGLDLGFVPGEGGKTAGRCMRRKGELDVLFLLGADEIDLSALGKAFVVYIGTTAMPARTAPT